MKTKLNPLHLCGPTLAVIFAVAASGCSSLKQAGEVGLGTGMGAAAGYALGEKKPAAVAGGAAVGGMTAALISSVSANATSKADGYREGIDDGYMQGSADEAKRLYFAKRELEATRDAGSAGQMSYYIWREQGATPDGRRLAPETVAVPLYEPRPVR